MSRGLLGTSTEAGPAQNIAAFVSADGVGQGARRVGLLQAESRADLRIARNRRVRSGPAGELALVPGCPTPPRCVDATCGLRPLEGQKRIAVPRRQRSITSKSTGGSAVSTPFSLRAELKGVEVAPGVTLRYWEAGAGRVLVMLPGLGHAASLYKYQLEGLCDEFRVIALDPRGHGESDKPERGYNYHTLAKDLDGFLRALNLNDATILGHSGGCKIILTYLELYGDSRLRAIVFSDDSPCHLRDGIFSADQALAAIDAFQGPDAIAFSKGFSDQFLTDDAEDSAKEAFYREGLKLPRPYMAKLFRWAAFGDWWDAYALVKVPTLVIGGRVSKVPVKIAQGIHEAVPGSSFVVFEADEGGGHAMFWEGPQKYNDSLRTFMRSY